MPHWNRRSVTALAGLTLAALIALPAAAFANTSAPIAQTGGMTATIPLLGSPLKVTVTLDAVGNISNVDLDPVGTFTASRVGPHAVSFANAGGTTQVKIKAKGNKMSIKTSSASLNDLLGSGTWSADVFGTGSPTDVAYTITAATDGSPILTIDSVTAPAGVTVDQKPVDTNSHDGDSSSSDRIDFLMNGFVKSLTIKVSLRDEGDRPASLSFVLSGKDKQKLSGTLASLTGAHAWHGTTCDGSPATVNFTVNGDGTVSFVSATPTATTKADEHGFKARFDASHTTVSVSLTQNKDGSWSLKVNAKSDRCGDTPAKTPTVNTPVAPNAVHSDGHGEDGHDAEREGGTRD